MANQPSSSAGSLPENGARLGWRCARCGASNHRDNKVCVASAQFGCNEPRPEPLSIDERRNLMDRAAVAAFARIANEVERRALIRYEATVQSLSIAVGPRIGDGPGGAHTCPSCRAECCCAEWYDGHVCEHPQIAGCTGPAQDAPRATESPFDRNRPISRWPLSDIELEYRFGALRGPASMVMASRDFAALRTLVNEIADAVSKFGSVLPERATDGVALIAAERKRQVESEGWSADHDSNHDHGELALAATCYALPADNRSFLAGFRTPRMWPWSDNDWKPTPFDRVHELVKAGALIAAEIDRLQRANAGDEHHGVTSATDGWGEPVQFACDDHTTGDELRLQIMPGGNGDWYVAVVQPDERMALRGVRISTSGGAAFSVPGLTTAIADAYAAMLRAFGTANNRGAVTMPTRSTVSPGAQTNG